MLNAPSLVLGLALGGAVNLTAQMGSGRSLPGALEARDFERAERLTRLFFLAAAPWRYWRRPD